MKAIVGIYRHDPRANKGQGQSRLASTIDLEVQVKELVRQKDWKTTVMKRVQDVVGENVATTTLGLMSFTRFVLSALSPVIAGFLYEGMGMDAVLYYAAAMYAVAAVLLFLVRMPGPAGAGPPRSGPHA